MMARVQYVLYNYTPSDELCMVSYARREFFVNYKEPKAGLIPCTISATTVPALSSRKSPDDAIDSKLRHRQYSTVASVEVYTAPDTTRTVHVPHNWRAEG